MLRPASVLEYIPGLIAEDQTATVKANVYLLRGFFLDHGTDILRYGSTTCPTTSPTIPTCTAISTSTA